MSSSQSTTPKWLAYIAWWITGLIFLGVEKNDEDLRWHAANSLSFFGAVTLASIALGILAFIPILGFLFGIVNWLLRLVAFVMWIVFMVKAGSGERIRIPFLTDFAEQNLINLFK